MRLLITLLLWAFPSQAIAGEIPHHDSGPPADFECRTATWHPPWNRQHCKDHAGFWVDGKCEHVEWQFLECRWIGEHE